MALTLLCTILALTACLLLLSCLFPAKALAWDPNSHDKLTNFALDLLAAHPHKCLLGWILAACRPEGESLGPAPPLLHPLSMAIEMQTRRGSVEEDMNSYLLSRKPFTQYHIETLEGANGGYHFYCPKRSESTVRGLTDASFFLWVIGAKGSGCQPPMPSALIRATSRELGKYDLGDEGRDWHLDSEKRNYTYDDAQDYYRNGYSHLAFYAIGRVCHLLQDMAVPAHVRDDAHVGGSVQGIGFDPSDPLERFAEEKDVPMPFRSSKGEGNYNLELWSFREDRVYRHDSVYTSALGGFSRTPGTVREYFHNLANRTFDTCYSFNTIPQNVDSHDPIDPRAMPFFSTKNLPKPQSLEAEDLTDTQRFGKYLAQNLEIMTVATAQPPPFLQPIDAGDIGVRCDVETDALWYMLERLAGLAKTLYDPKRIPPTVSIPGLGKPDAPDFMLTALDQIDPGPPKDTTGEGIAVDTRKIIGVGCRLAPLSNARVADMLDAVLGWGKDAEKIVGQLALLEAETGVAPDAGYSEAALALTEFCDEAQPQRLLELLRADSGHDPADALARWIFSPGMNFKILRKWFYAPIIPIEEHIPDFLPINKVKEMLRDLGACHYQGPFCLSGSTLSRQYLRQQEAAVRQTANLLASWFESLFSDDYPPLAAFENANAATPDQLPSLAPVRPCAGSLQIGKWASLALFNHLPIDIDLNVEITLIEDGTDKELVEQGVLLAIDWDLLLAQGVDQPAKEKKTYVTEALQEFLATAPCRELAASFSLNLGGEYDASATIKRSLVPYNLEVLARLVLPTGDWSPGSTDMGGVRREQESTLLPPLVHDRRDAPELGRNTCSMLRIRPVGPAEAKNPTDS